MSTNDSYQNNLRRKACLIIVTDVNMRSKRLSLQKSKGSTKFNDRKNGFYLNKIIVFGVFLSQHSPWIMSSAKCKIENIDVQVARRRAFLSKLPLT